MENKAEIYKKRPKIPREWQPKSGIRWNLI
jgi:hypothetical protein